MIVSLNLKSIITRFNLKKHKAYLLLIAYFKNCSQNKSYNLLFSIVLATEVVAQVTKKKSISFKTWHYNKKIITSNDWPNYLFS